MFRLPHSPQAPARAEEHTVKRLAHLRYELRCFLRSVDTAEHGSGITPRQLDLLLGVAAFARTGQASISNLADFLQEKHNSVVGLIDRAEQNGLVRRRSASSDRRVVLISLTRQGKKALARTVACQWEQAKRIRETFSCVEGE